MKTLKSLGKYREKRRSKPYMWFANISVKLASRYIKDCHPSFMKFIEKTYLSSTLASIQNDASTKRLKAIMRVLNSDKYKKFFYEAIKYKRGEISLPPKKWYVRIFNKIIYNLSKTYVFLFERELYRKIKWFEITSKGVVDLTKAMDKYIASTTPEQRLVRMRTLGIISNQTFIDDFDILFKRIPESVIEERYKTVPPIKGHVFTGMERKLPDDIFKLINKA